VGEASKIHSFWEWWYIPIIPAFRRLRQEDWEFEASLGLGPCLKKIHSFNLTSN
jgi:predicted glycosyl hydrolase (DUF1957 family)